MPISPCTTERIFTLLDWIRSHRLRNGHALPLCIWGDRGVGKTQVVSEYARARGMGFITYHPAHDRGSGDLIGEAWRDEETNHTHFSAPHFLPAANDVTALEPRGIFLIDELNRASTEVLSGLFELIGEGEIRRSRYQLPRGWQIVCCCNPPDAEYDVTRLDAALIDRMLHVTFSFSSDAWLDWATDEGLEDDVVEFVRDNVHRVAVSPPELPSGVEPVPTPRALEHFATLYEPTMDTNLLDIVAHGLLGEETAAAFLAREPGEGRPLSADQMIRGLWRRYFPRWHNLSGIGQDLIFRSLLNLLRSLRSHPRDPMLAGALCNIRDGLDPAMRAHLVKALGTHCPDWLQLMEAIDAGLADDEETLFRTA